ncbi:hypothetical protein GW17_00037645 [Ensete ventricosum]|nr:hypothetical protein GW17_00037645 [Ensete ventricosum]
MARVSFSPTFLLSSARSKFPCPTPALIPKAKSGYKLRSVPTHRKVFDLRPCAVTPRLLFQVDNPRDSPRPRPGPRHMSRTARCPQTVVSLRGVQQSMRAIKTGETHVMDGSFLIVPLANPKLGVVAREMKIKKKEKKKMDVGAVVVWDGGESLMGETMPSESRHRRCVEVKGRRSRTVVETSLSEL